MKEQYLVSVFPFLLSDSLKTLLKNGAIEWKKKCQILHNDVPVKKLFENYPNLEIKSNKVIENSEESMKMNFKTACLRKLNVDLMV